jgi:hypothetical protein
MAGRAGGVSFRPRPCDPTAKLVVLRSLDELDADAVSAVQRPPANNHAHLDRENEEVRPLSGAGAGEEGRGGAGGEDCLPLAHSCALARSLSSTTPDSSPPPARLPRHQVLTVKPKGGTDAEIPTPEVWNVASYAADYKPVYRPPPSYLRGAPASPAPRISQQLTPLRSRIQGRGGDRGVRPGQRRRRLARRLQRHPAAPASRAVRGKPQSAVDAGGC